MMRLACALADPQSALSLDDAGWTALLCMAKAERLDGTLAHRLKGLPVPERVAEILNTARMNAAEARARALWEVEMARRALAPLGVPVVLLKGSAFLAAGLDAGQGRLVGDLDILVPRDALADVEATLLGAGWEWLKADAYDDHYYRTWMHELPPLIHRDRDAMIDVHHTILPLTARPKPDAAAMIRDSTPFSVRPELVEGLSFSPDAFLEEGQGFDRLSPDGRGAGLHILKPEDMVVHAAAHLFADGDLSGALRNLWDIRCLIEEFSLEGLRERARMHGLLAEVERALRISDALFIRPCPSGEMLGMGPVEKETVPVFAETIRPTPTPPLKGRGLDRLYVKRLLARDGWGRETRKGLRFAFYLRSHLIRMPLPLLLRHLWTKWRKGSARA